MRRAARRDGNEIAIITALERDGCLVQQLTQGDGVPDLLVWSPHIQRFVVLEVKDEAQAPNKRRLTADESDWHKRWERACSAIFVVENPGQALARVRLQRTNLAEQSSTLGVPLKEQP